MKLLFCPQCAGKLTANNKTVYECVNGHPYYNNPATTATAILIKDGKLLFAERGVNPGKGKYDFPGGFLEYNEDPYAGVRRELNEELGIELNDLELIDVSSGVYDENVSTCDVIFICTRWKGDINATDDVASVSWRSPEFMKSDQFNCDYPRLYDRLMEYFSKSEA